jgi:hypothetical protein
MKKGTQYLLLFVWVLISTGLLARWWITSLFQYINFPQPVWNYLAKLYAVENADQGGDLEVLVGLLTSLIVVVVLTAIALNWVSKK